MSLKSGSLDWRFDCIKKNLKAHLNQIHQHSLCDILDGVQMIPSSAKPAVWDFSENDQLIYPVLQTIFVESWVGAISAESILLLRQLWQGTFLFLVNQFECEQTLFLLIIKRTQQHLTDQLLVYLNTYGTRHNVDSNSIGGIRRPIKVTLYDFT